jgi:hypothetical protein
MSSFFSLSVYLTQFLYFFLYHGYLVILSIFMFIFFVTVKSFGILLLGVFC